MLFDNKRIKYPTSISVRIKLGDSSVKIYSHLQSNNCYDYGLLVLVRKTSNVNVHLNGIWIDHKTRRIERFEPYGCRSKAMRRDAKINELLANAVSKFYKNGNYSCNLFYVDCQGPQSNDVTIADKYCLLWSILYLETKQMKEEDQKNSLTELVKNDPQQYNATFVKEYATHLYNNYSNKSNNEKAKLNKN